MHAPFASVRLSLSGYAFGARFRALYVQSAAEARRLTAEILFKSEYQFGVIPVCSPGDVPGFDATTCAPTSGRFYRALTSLDATPMFDTFVRRMKEPLESGATAVAPVPAAVRPV